MKKRFADIGQEIWPTEQQNPAALAAQQKAEIERWWPIIKAAGIKVTINLLDAGTAPASRRIGHSDSRPGRNNALRRVTRHDASTHIAARAIPNDTIVNATATDTASANVSATNA